MLHLIEHLEKVTMFMNDGKTKNMADALHVPTITKNLVFVWGPWTDVKFDKHGYFVEGF